MCIRDSLEIVVLIALVAVHGIVVHDVPIVIVDHELGVVILGCGDDLHTAIAKELVDRGQLCIGNVDIFKDDLNLVLSDGTGLRSEVEKLLDGRVQRGSSAVSYTHL